MPNEFVCSECRGDGTRCRCHESRGPRLYPPTVEERIRANEETLRILRERMLKGGRW